MKQLAEAIFSGRSKCEIEDHYRKNIPPDGISVIFKESRGKGLFASRSYAVGETIFTERCLVGLQARKIAYRKMFIFELR